MSQKILIKKYHSNVVCRYSLVVIVVKKLKDILSLNLPFLTSNENSKLNFKEKRKNFFEKFYFETFQFVLNVQIAQHGVVNHLLGKQKTC